MERFKRIIVLKILGSAAVFVFILTISNNCLLSRNYRHKLSKYWRQENQRSRSPHQSTDRPHNLEPPDPPAFSVIPVNTRIPVQKRSCFEDYFLLPERVGTRVEMFQPILLEEKMIFRCSIPKNLMTQLKALYCRMILDRSSPRLSKIAANPSNIRVRGHNCELERIELDGSQDERLEAVFASPEWFRFAIIRDPLERFISGYLDRCLRAQGKCYDCGTDIACFAKYTYSAFLKVLDRGGIVTGGMPTYVNHIMPQYWYCRFRDHLHDYHYLHYNKSEDFTKAFRADLMDWGFPPSLIETGWGENMTEPFLAVRTDHASAMDDALRYKQFILSHLPTLNYIFRMYIVDYVKFNLPTPFEAVVTDLCANEPQPDKYAICSAYAPDCGNAS